MSNKTLYGILFNVKLKTVLHSMMLFMGLIFLGIQYYTVTNYSFFINESNIRLKSDVIKTLVRERLIHHHYREAQSIAEKIVSDPLFRKSYIAEDRGEIKRFLHGAAANKQGSLDILGISVLSRDYKAIAGLHGSISRQLLLKYQQKSSITVSLKPSSYFYISDAGNPVHMLIFPFDEDKTQGFLLLVTSPLSSLEGIREFIETEADVIDISYQTKIAINQNLTSTVNPLNPAILEIPVSLTDGEPFLNIVVRYDSRGVLHQQSKLNTFGTLAAAMGLLVALYIVSYVLNISMLSRIRKISEALAHIIQGKTAVKLSKVHNDELSDLWEQLERVAANEEDRNRLSYELVFALKAAENSSLAKAEFLTNMSHELRTPLNAIIGFSEIMTSDYLASDLSDRYRVYAQDIRDSGLLLLNIINDILDLSNIETGDMVVATEEVDVGNIIGKSVNQINNAAIEKSISIEKKVAKNLPKLYVDERMIQQCLINILTNSVKFTMEDGNIIINAGMENNGTFCIAISDNGIGIEDAQMEKIISPFCHVSESYTREQEGTGLGLTLVKAFMELHGGSMRLESIWGVGTTAYLIFPDSCLQQETAEQNKFQKNELLLISQAN